MLAAISGIKPELLKLEMTIHPDSEWFNEADSLEEITQNKDGSTQFTIKPLWFTEAEGGCATPQNEDGSYVRDAEGNVVVNYGIAKLKLKISYNNSVIATILSERDYKVRLFRADGVMDRNPESGGMPEFLSTATNGEFIASDHYRSEIQWGNVWGEKIGVVTISEHFSKTQYAAKAIAEENYHKQQWEEGLTSEKGGCDDLFTKKGTMFHSAMSGNGPFYRYGSTAAETKSAALDEINDAKGEEEDVCFELLAHRRGLREKAAGTCRFSRNIYL